MNCGHCGGSGKCRNWVQENGWAGSCDACLMGDRVFALLPRLFPSAGMWDHDGDRRRAPCMFCSGSGTVTEEQDELMREQRMGY